MAEDRILGAVFRKGRPKGHRVTVIREKAQAEKKEFLVYPELMKMS